jgi:predicted membrane-bound spermidine synthase
MYSKIVLGIVYAVIFTTGFTGLVYQVAWQKYLSRLLGSDSIATAIILATFLGGLSMGYFLCGQMTVRTRNHFRGYALLEGIIGLWCLLFPRIFDLTDQLTRGWSFSPPFWIILQGLVCCTLLIGIPTICMGGTIPFLTSGLSRSLGEATRVHAHVYAINTAGAFLGTLLAGFYLIPEYGLPLTVKGTACLNFGACLFFFLLASWTRVDGNRSVSVPMQGKKDSPPVPSLRHRPAMLYAIAFLSGFYVMTLENVLIRITNLSLGGSSYSFSLIVAAFILAIAVGSHMVGRLRDLPGNLLFLNQLGIAVLLLLVFATLDTWPYWAHLLRITFQANMAGFWAYYAAAFLALLLLLVVPVGLMGATVPITFHEVKRDLANVGRHSGLLFSCNTLGNLTGSLVGGIGFYYFMDNNGVFLSALLLAVISTILAARPLGRNYLLGSGAIAALALSVGLSTRTYDKSNFMIGTFRIREPVVDSFSGPTAFFKSYFQNEELLFYRDGVANTVAVTNQEDDSGNNRQSRSIIVNGKSDSSTRWDIHTLKLLAHMPALFCGHTAKKAMVIGLGTGVTAGELSLHPGIEQIEVAEISPTVIEALPLFGDFTHNVHHNPKVTIHLGDAFRVIGRSDKKWDIIISEPSNPWVTGVDLLFTDRFYQQAKSHLTEGGVFLQWVQIYNTAPEVLGMVMRTISEKFGYVRVFAANAGDLLLLASEHDLSSSDILRAETMWRDNQELSASLADIGITSMDALLLREIWSPAYVKENFRQYDLQSMDNPRLHYLAGKNFFLGSQMKLRSLLEARTAAYWPSYAMAKHYPDWRERCIDDSSLRAIVDGLTNITLHEDLATLADATALKTMATANCSTAALMFAGPDYHKTHAILRVMAGQSSGREDWQILDLGEKSLHQRAEALIATLARSRNWIAAYPIDGLLALLARGFQESVTVEEQNWFLLQNAMLRISDGSSVGEIRDLLTTAHRDQEGQVLINTGEQKLLQEIERFTQGP